MTRNTLGIATVFALFLMIPDPAAACGYPGCERAQKNFQRTFYQRDIMVKRHVSQPRRTKAACGNACDKPKPCCASPTKQTIANTSKVSGLKAIAKGDGASASNTVTVNQTSVNIFGGGMASRRIAGSRTTITVDRWARVSSCLSQLGLTQGPRNDFWTDGNTSFGNVHLRPGLKSELRQTGKLPVAEACLAAS